jgi:hypothetical protein
MGVVSVSANAAAAAASASAAAFEGAGSVCSPFDGQCDPATYGGSSSLWLTQELPRLLATLPKHRPNDGLVLTRGAW